MGLLSFEREITQDLYLDISLKLDIEKDGYSDTLEHSPDYSAIAESMTKWIQTEKFQLLEAICIQGCNKLLMEYPLIQEASIKVRKPAAIANAFAAEIEHNQKRN